MRARPPWWMRRAMGLTRPDQRDIRTSYDDDEGARVMRIMRFMALKPGTYGTEY